jgi:hypothetical protein
VHLYKGKVERSDMRGGSTLHAAECLVSDFVPPRAIEVDCGEFGLVGVVSHLPRLVLSLRDLRAEGCSFESPADKDIRPGLTG